LPIQPLAQVPNDPLVAALPKADVHLHYEDRARLDRIFARRQGRPPYEWRKWARRLLAEPRPGYGRLVRLFEPYLERSIKNGRLS
jgi:hypothetical protein